jgi:hypothetical protein
LIAANRAKALSFAWRVLFGRSALDGFAKTWKYHDPLMPEQLAFAGREATVKSVGFYHGGDVLYVLNDVPGIWHERCLEPLESASVPSRKHKDRLWLWWYVTLGRAAFVVAICGIVAIALGLLCLPVPLFDIRGITSLFAVLRATGSFTRFAHPLLVVGGFLLFLSLFLKLEQNMMFGQRRGSR